MITANTVIIIGIILCFFMNYGVGANDLANVMSTSMGSKSINVRQAVIIAIVFEFAGAFLGGTSVTETMRDHIINMSALNGNPYILIQGMLSILLACTIWMNLASFFGLPISITNALVGSMVGFGSIVLGSTAIHWNKVITIAVSWITSPLIAGSASFILFSSMQILIFIKPDPLQKAKRYIPCYLFLLGVVLSFITIHKGLNHFNFHFTFYQNFLITIVFSFVLTLIGYIWLRKMPEKNLVRRHERFMQIEKYFAYLMVLTTCVMVFAHGSNDVALAVAPLSIIHTLITHPEAHNMPNSYPSWIISLGCIGVICGFLIYGKKVIETVGSSITMLTPSRAFAATLAAATTVVVATSTGIPVSATQTLVGAVLGVGLARGIGALNLIVIRNIFMSWVFTLPAASFLTIVIYVVIHYFFRS